jgi:dTDP-4-dehydrorhamnose reductase
MDEYEIIGTFRNRRPQLGCRIEKLDLLNLESIRSLIIDSAPSIVIHAAAMTGVDACEKDPGVASAVNERATEIIAQSCREVGSHMVYVSTDYVFDGTKGNYTEEDLVNPLQTYGITKLAGEEGVLKLLPNSSTVVRTSVVFDSISPNFVTWLIDAMNSKESVTVIDDQCITPTHASDLARKILLLVEMGKIGIWNVACSDRLNRYDFAKSISKRFDFDTDRLKRGKMSEMPWIAHRPRDSSLCTEKLSGLIDPIDTERAIDMVYRELAI